MALIVKERIVRLIVEYTIVGNRLTTGLHYGLDSAMVPGDPEAIVNAFEATVLPSWQNIVSEQVRFQKIYAYAIVPSTAYPGEDKLVGSVGTISGDALPSNIAAVVQLRQNDVPSDANGRMFIAGVAEADVEGSLITGAAITAQFANFATALAPGLDLGSGRTAYLCVVKRRSDNAPVEPTGFTVTQVTPTRALRTQRRRTVEWGGYRA